MSKRKREDADTMVARLVGIMSEYEFSTADNDSILQNVLLLCTNVELIAMGPESLIEDQLGAILSRYKLSADDRTTFLDIARRLCVEEQNGRLPTTQSGAAAAAAGAGDEKSSARRAIEAEEAKLKAKSTQLVYSFPRSSRRGADGGFVNNYDNACYFDSLFQIWLVGCVDGIFNHHVMEQAKEGANSLVGRLVVLMAQYKFSTDDRRRVLEQILRTCMDTSSKEKREAATSRMADAVSTTVGFYNLSKSDHDAFMDIARRLCDEEKEGRVPLTKFDKAAGEKADKDAREKHGEDTYGAWKQQRANAAATAAAATSKSRKRKSTTAAAAAAEENEIMTAQQVAPSQQDVEASLGCGGAARAAQWRRKMKALESYLKALDAMREDKKDLPVTGFESALADPRSSAVQKADALKKHFRALKVAQDAGVEVPKTSFDRILTEPEISPCFPAAPCGKEGCEPDFARYARSPHRIRRLLLAWRFGMLNHGMRLVGGCWSVRQMISDTLMDRDLLSETGMLGPADVFEAFYRKMGVKSCVITALQNVTANTICLVSAYAWRLPINALPAPDAAGIVRINDLQAFFRVQEYIDAAGKQMLSQVFVNSSLWISTELDENVRIRYPKLLYLPSGMHAGFVDVFEINAAIIYRAHHHKNNTQNRASGHYVSYFKDVVESKATDDRWLYYDDIGFRHLQDAGKNAFEQYDIQANARMVLYVYQTRVQQPDSPIIGLQPYLFGAADAAGVSPFSFSSTFSPCFPYYSSGSSSSSSSSSGSSSSSSSGSSSGSASSGSPASYYGASSSSSAFSSR